jgi:hypothetical protein
MAKVSWQQLTILWVEYYCIVLVFNTNYNNLLRQQLVKSSIPQTRYGSTVSQQLSDRIPMNAVHGPC